MTDRHSLCALLALIALPALAQETQPVELLQAQHRAVIDTLVASDTVSEAQIRWISKFLADDLDGIPGLTERDLFVRGAIRDARLRSDRVAQQLRSDLNGDLSITRDELLPFERAYAMGPIRNGTRTVAPTDAQAEEIARQMVERRLSADTSGDGILTLEELLAEPLKKYVAMSELYDPSRAPFASLLDGDGDGTVTESEFMVPLLAGADRMDTNGDGILSLIEKQQRTDRPVPKTARQKQDRALMDALMPRRVCDLAPKSADAQVLVLGGYEGAALSDIVFGREERPAYVVDLVIPSGARPLALVLAFQEPVILRLSGAPERLTEVLTLGAPYGIVNRPKAAFRRAGSAQGPCDLNLWRAPPDDDVRETLRTWTGRTDVIIAAAYTIGTVTLGEADAEISVSLPDGHQPDFGAAAMEVWAEMLRYNPGGLILLDPDGVDTPGYLKTGKEIWPQEAGLAQLVEDGALTPLSDRSVQDMRMADSNGVIAIGSKKVRWKGGDDVVRDADLNYTQEELGRWIGRRPPLYRINEPITLPSGMYGAHMAEFLLPANVPEPLGDRGDVRLRPDD